MGYDDDVLSHIKRKVIMKFDLRYICLCFISILFAIAPTSVFADVEINHLGNIAIDPWSGSGDTSGGTPFCVYNSASANYRIRAATPGNTFRVTSGTFYVSFDAQFFDDSTDSGTPHDLTAGTWAGAFSNAYTLSGTDGGCGTAGNNNAYFKVIFRENALSSATAGTNYSGSLTITVEAQ